MGGECRRRRIPRCAVELVAAALLNGCTWLPSEFNVSPLFRQRLDESGELLELDVLWPLVHFERTPRGGTDFRIRPFYRRVVEPEQDDRELPATEHQFLWPLGRVRTDPEQSTHRLFPFWSYRSRQSADDGKRDIDWYALFPFVWGGYRDDDRERYFGVFPLYADLPQFLTYDRVRFVCWPLYTGTEKNGRRGHVFLWPFAGFGSGPGGYAWHRLLPLYSVAVSSSYRRFAFLFPLLSWGTEAMEGVDPIRRFFLWPLFGRQSSQRVSAWTLLWPLFQRMRLADRIDKLDVMWPIFRSHVDRSESTPRRQWWVWPLVARTITDDQWAWVFLWPLIWLREYSDPGSDTTQTVVIPFYTRTATRRPDGSGSAFLRVWPMLDRSSEFDSDGAEVEGGWRLLSPIPWHGGNVYGVHESYGWLWTLAEARRRSPEDSSFEITASLYTTRQRAGRTQTSVPFLFSHEHDGERGTLRLFQVLPISW